MPTNIVKTPHDGKLWSEAKAKEQGKSKNYAYINGTFQQMKGNNL